MTGAPAAFQLAPAGLLRSAAWPAAVMRPFGDPALGELAVSGSSSFEQAYAQVLERERAHLWAATLGDPGFEKALALGSPSARARASAAAARRDGPRNRALRRAEHTLYRYLARAAGRATPHGLWAGTAVVSFDDHARSEAVPARCRFAPDLAPFQALARGLAGRAPYRRRARWRLNPTVHPDPGGGWRFLARSASGRVERCRLEPEAGLAPVLAALAVLPALPMSGLAAEVARAAGWPPAARRRVLRILDRLADGGLLVGGLDLAPGSATPWDALERVAGDLDGADRAAWRDAVAALRAICARLDGDALTLPVDGFAAALGAARDRVAALSCRLAVPCAGLPDAVLRCDLELPWRLTLDAARRRAIETALDEYHRCWLAPLSPATALRREHARTVAAAAPGAGLSLAAAAWDARPPPRLPRVWPAADGLPDADLRRRVADWEGWLASGAHEVVLPRGDAAPAAADAPPVGALILGLHAGGMLGVHGLGDAPLHGSARHAEQLAGLGVVRWARAALAGAAGARGLGAAQLRVPFESNPNVLCGPALADTVLEPWGADPDAACLHGARLRATGDGDALALMLPGSPVALCVFATGASDPASRDPLARALLGSGWQWGGAGGRALDVPLDGEIGRGRLAPAVRLPGGALLRRRRSVLAGDALALACSTGRERFRHWQRLARELGWPPRLRASFGGGEPLTLHRDSPLGVEALFKGVPAGASDHAASPGPALLVVEDAPEGDALPLPGRGAHVSELEIGFARTAPRRRGRT